jgi:hypothetical protein
MRPALRVWIDALIDRRLIEEDLRGLVGLRARCIFAWLERPPEIEIPENRIPLVLMVDEAQAWAASKVAIDPLLGPGASEILLHRLADYGLGQDQIEEEFPFVEIPMYRMRVTDGPAQPQYLSDQVLHALTSAVEPEVTEYVTSIQKLEASRQSQPADMEVLVPPEALVRARLA